MGFSRLQSARAEGRLGCYVLCVCEVMGFNGCVVSCIVYVVAGGEGSIRFGAISRVHIVDVDCGIVSGE
jgi:hypothetical protein